MWCPGSHRRSCFCRDRVSTLLDAHWDKHCGVQVSCRAGEEAEEMMGTETRVAAVTVSQVPQEPRVESHPLKGMGQGHWSPQASPPGQHLCCLYLSGQGCVLTV